MVNHNVTRSWSQKHIMNLVGPIRSWAKSELFDRAFPIAENGEIGAFRSQAFYAVMQFGSHFKSIQL